MKLILITGFLGTGKTTFLKKLLPTFGDKKLALIVNEFGKVGMDGAVLSQLGATLREITGGSVFCSCRQDQFEAALGKVAVENPDIILVEASGLSDPTAVKAVVENTPNVNYAGCIALCDALRLEKVLATVRVSKKQLAVSDLILLNKKDLVSEEKLISLVTMLEERYPKAKVKPTEQANFKQEWINEINPHAQSVEQVHSGDITLQKVLIKLAPNLTYERLIQLLKLFAEDTFRIKGFVKLQEGYFQVDCVSNVLNVFPCNESIVVHENEIVGLAGEGMPLRKSLKETQKWYPDNIVEFKFGG